MMPKTLASRLAATLASTLALGVAGIAAPAMAQTAVPIDAPAGGGADDIFADSVFDDTYITVGAGVSVGPSYDGSDDYVFSVLPVATGAVGGIAFSPRGPGLAFDIVRDTQGAAVDFQFGPVFTVNLDRVNNIDDPVVELLGERDVAIEIGPSVGVQFNRLLNPFDSVTAAVDVKWDVAGAHNGMLVTPSLTYSTPVSQGAAVSLSLNAEYVDDDYADYYFSVSPAGSLASGLPVFGADGGFKNVGASLFGGIDLDGNALNGGFGIFVIGSYSRLLEDAKRSPVTSVRGDADQWFGAVGIGYTF